MTIDLSKLFVLGLLSASIHWIIARSMIAKPLWSRTRGFFDELLRCPACSGWWLGSGLGIAGLHPLEFHDDRVASVMATAVLATILTPVFESVLLWGLQRSAIAAREEVGAVPDEEVGVHDQETPNTEDAITPLDRPRAQ